VCDISTPAHRQQQQSHQAANDAHTTAPSRYELISFRLLPVPATQDFFPFFFVREQRGQYFTL